MNSSVRHPLPPGPRGYPILGMLPALRRDPIGVYTEALQKYGDVVYFKIGPRQGFLATHPDDIRHVLQDNARNYHKSPLYEKLKAPLGNGLLTSEDAFWLRQRRMAQPAFHRQRVARLAAIMAACAAETARSWQPAVSTGEPLNVADEMMRLTQTIILRTLLGADLGPLARQVDEAWAVVNRYIGESFWSLGLMDRWPTPRNRRFWRSIAVLDRAVYHIIEQRRRSGGDADDLLSMLIAARDEDTGEGMTDRQLRDEVMTIFLAGHETTSLAMAWTWHLLGTNAAPRARMEAELDEALDDRLPQFDDLVRLPYTRMVIEEAMRLYPPAWGFSRVSLAADEIGGYRLPPTWLVFIIPYVMHRHPAYWNDPDRFDPERFTPERVAQRPKFVYLPFGGGPRQCIGSQFALIEAHLILATLAQRFRLTPVPGHKVEPWPLITLRPRHGVQMIVEKRTAARRRIGSRSPYPSLPMDGAPISRNPSHSGEPAG